MVTKLDEFVKLYSQNYIAVLTITHCYSVLNLLISEPLIEEFYIGINIFIIGTGRCELMSVAVKKDIEWLGIGTEHGTLQIAPLVANGAKSTLLAILWFLRIYLSHALQALCPCFIGQPV